LSIFHEYLKIGKYNLFKKNNYEFIFMAILYFLNFTTQDFILKNELSNT